MTGHPETALARELELCYTSLNLVTDLDAGAESGEGVVVLMNANDNSPMMARIHGYVARLWGFAGTPPVPVPAATVAARIDAKRLAAYAGYYEASENNMIALGPNPDGSGMQVLVDGRPAENLLAMDSATFGSSERPFRAAFTVGAGGAVTGAKRDFVRGDPALADFASATYLGEEDVSGRGIRRHGSEVSRVRLYRMRTKNGERWLMVHVTAEGAVTDYDIVLR
jgi:hypothetical protein